MSFVKGLKCKETDCGRSYPNEPRNICEYCFGKLEVDYDYDAIGDESGKLRRHFNIHVNGSEDVRMLEGMDTALADGDSVAILSAIAGGAPGQVARKVWLTFAENLVEEPLIWQVAQKFKVVTNIRQASISKHIGLVGLELSGEQHEVAKAIEFFAEKGVSVEPVEQDVVE